MDTSGRVVDVLALKPTQIALGMREVQFRVEKLSKMKAKELQEYLRTHPVPVVAGPDKALYCIDKHHLARACWEADIEKVHIHLTADLSHLPLKKVWQVMSDAHWIYPYDQYGSGPHLPAHLPENIRGMADDPYRSLAWMVREKGGFEKAGFFSEFKWANFYRKGLDSHPVLDGFDVATKEAMTLSKSKAARNLPGYKGK